MDVSDNGLLSMFLVTILIWESTKAKPLWAESAHNGPAIVSTLGEISWQMWTTKILSCLHVYANCQSRTLRYFGFFFLHRDKWFFFFTAHILCEVFRKQKFWGLSISLLKIRKGYKKSFGFFTGCACGMEMHSVLKVKIMNMYWVLSARMWYLS